MTQSIELGGFTFHTDGSVLVCDNHPYALSIIKQLNNESIAHLREFITANMKWMENKDCSNIEEAIKESLYTYCDNEGNMRPSINQPPHPEGIDHLIEIKIIEHQFAMEDEEYRRANVDIPENIEEELVDLNENHPFTPLTYGVEKENEKNIPASLVDNACMIVHAMHPYLAEQCGESLVDDFYNPTYHHIFNPAMLRSRNHKEFIAEALGGYSKGACEGIYPHRVAEFGRFLEENNIPLEHKIKILEYSEGHTLDYILMVLSYDTIDMTAQRLINWFDNHPADDVMDAMHLIFTCHDCPYVAPPSTRGDMRSVVRRCDELLDNINWDEYVNNDPRPLLTVKRSSDYNLQVDLGREPDMFFQDHAVTLVRTAVDLNTIGDSMNICIGSPSYQNKLEKGTAQFFVINHNDSPVAVEYRDGKIVEARGVRNSRADNTDIIKEAIETFNKDNDYAFSS